MNFKDLKLSAEMLNTLGAIGFEKPSEIQAETIPHILQGKDIIGQAKTGTGKTASFAIPIIENTKPGKGIQHVVLAPSRELARQIQQEFITLSKHKNINIVNIIGGVSYDIQRINMMKKPEILIATPGRLIDHLESKRISIDFSHVQSLTLDEADEMLNYGFYKSMLQIDKFLPKKKQTLLFTATLNKRTKELVTKLLTNPVKISVSSGLSTNDIVTQEYVVIKEKSKLVTLYNLLNLYDHKSIIIFGKTRRRVDQLTEALQKLGFSAKGIQGDMKQSLRSKTMKDFRDQKIKIIIGTDVLARGIDVESVDLVFNFDLPTEVEYYTHRIGRTGRAGKTGKAISFVKTSEMTYFTDIVKTTNSEVKQIEAPTDGDMEEYKASKLDKELSDLLHLGREKYRLIGAKIAEEYTPEHLGIIVAAAVIGNQANPYNIELTGENGGDRKRKGGSGRSSSNKRNDRRSSNNGGGSSRGRSNFSKSSKNKKSYKK